MARWYEHFLRNLKKLVIGDRPQSSLYKSLNLVRIKKPAKTEIVKILIIACLLPLLLLISPAWGQSTQSNNAQTAPIRVKNEVLFEVGAAKEQTAAERAESINSILENQLKSGEPIKVEIEDKNQETNIRINNSHLLTITDTDIRGGNTKSEQALIWKNRLEKALSFAYKKNQPGYLLQVLVISLIIIVAALALQLFLRWLGINFYQNSQEKFPQATPYLQRFSPLISLAITSVIWIAVVLYITDLLPLIRDYRNLFLNILLTSFTSPLFRLGTRGFSIVDLLVLIGLTLGLWTGVRSFIGIFRNRIIGLTGAERSVQDTISFLTQYGLIFFGLLIILQLWGVDVSSLAIIASALGVGIGFGLQNVANNFISGIIIIFERPIQVGDFIQVGDLVGVVERIGLRSTHIATLDQVSLIVPNSRFLENEVLNWSHGNPISRVRVPIGVAYGSDIQLVRKAILEVAKSHPEVLLHPSPQLWFQEFADSSLNFDLFVWTREPRKQYRLKSELNYRIEANLRKYNINIPFPQRDLHIKSPEIEQMIHTWMSQNTAPPVELYYPNSIQDKYGNKISQLPLNENQDTTVSTTDSIMDGIDKKIDIDVLIEQMRGNDGISIKDRRHQWDVYEKCFVGSEAVEWLMRTQKLNLNEAISVGQLLIDRGLIHHVSDKHGFKNEYLLYRFYADEQ